MTDAGADHYMQGMPGPFDLITEPYAAPTATVVVPQSSGGPPLALGMCFWRPWEPACGELIGSLDPTLQLGRPAGVEPQFCYFPGRGLHMALP